MSQDKQVVALSERISLVIEPLTVDKLETRGTGYKAWKTYHVDSNGEMLGMASCVCECEGPGYWCKVSSFCDGGVIDDCTQSGSGCSVSCH